MQAKESGAGITLRLFTSADITALAALHVAARASMQLFDEPYSVSEHASYIAGLSVGCLIIVAEKAGKPIGFLAYARKPNDTAGLISQLFVDPEHQRQGVGKALLQDALNRFPRPIELWCFEANTRARTFYDANDFVIAERTDGQMNNEKLPNIRYKLR